MDNNLNLWSGIELTWENILARTFYGTDIYSHILQTYYPHDFLLHVKGDDCGWVRNPWDSRAWRPRQRSKRPHAGMNASLTALRVGGEGAPGTGWG